VTNNSREVYVPKRGSSAHSTYHQETGKKNTERLWKGGRITVSEKVKKRCTRPNIQGGRGGERGSKNKLFMTGRRELTKHDRGGGDQLGGVKTQGGGRGGVNGRRQKLLIRKVGAKSVYLY